MNPSVCILDYGSGNVRSVFNIFKTITDNAIVSNSKSKISSATHLVLPGVGSFGGAMKKINKKIPVEFVREQVIEKSKPFLGICVGMQVLADVGHEFGEHKGLGWVNGKVRKLKVGKLPLPHIGWNDLLITKKSKLFKGFDKGLDVYFLHSYVFDGADKKNIVATAEYGETFTAAIESDNIYGVQFHPEKSQKAGRLLLENFIKIL